MPGGGTIYESEVRLVMVAGPPVVRVSSIVGRPHPANNQVPHIRQLLDSGTGQGAGDILACPSSDVPFTHFSPVAVDF